MCLKPPARKQCASTYWMSTRFPSTSRTTSFSLWFLTNKKGEEYFVLPERLIHILLAIAGLIALIYIMLNFAGYI